MRHMLFLIAGCIAAAVRADEPRLLFEVKDVKVEPLAATPATSGTKAGKAAGSVPLSAADEAGHFTLAEGFTAELVLEESTDPANAYGKFVALAFDAHGRLWTTTAMDYPVDGNESPEASRRLFEAGGRDKVLVVDDPWAAKPSPPRVFAEGLAIPLGVMPHRDGAFVQYGPEIRFYRDTTGDGRADGHETVLEGFGVQDSHLFPHQFTRVPGDWILLAQGLFNNSMVKRPGGVPFADGAQEVPFVACKLGRFRPDGSALESLTAGPNNIWGLTISREGQAWLQEANDIGFPIFPYEPGVLVKTGSPDRLRPYQPMMPAPLGPPQMGGSGLSGLALAALFQNKLTEAVKYAQAAVAGNAGSALAHYTLSAVADVAGTAFNRQANDKTRTADETAKSRAAATQYAATARTENSLAGKLDAKNLAGRPIPDAKAVYTYLSTFGRTPVLTAPK